MNTKRDCWLCGLGTGLDNGGMSPGELKTDFFGDVVCIYCESRINFMGMLLANPEVIPLVSVMGKLPKAEGWSVGLRKLEEEDA